MDKINNEDIEDICYSISKKIIIPKFCNLDKSDLMRKSNNDLVTTVDIAVENKLKKDLTKLLPTSLFVGEELFEKNNSILEFYNQNDYCWTVDPIDGTKNFCKGKKEFAIMITLSFKDKILQSWIYKPLIEEMTYALANEGSYTKNIKLFSNNIYDIKNTSGSISTKYWSDIYSNLMKNIKQEFSNVLSYGCIGYEYIDIANGKRDFAIISKLSPWDHMPGILIAREAGSYDIYFDYGSYDHRLRKFNLIVASNKILGNKILNLIKGEKL